MDMLTQATPIACMNGKFQVDMEDASNAHGLFQKGMTYDVLLKFSRNGRSQSMNWGPKVALKYYQYHSKYINVL